MEGSQVPLWVKGMCWVLCLGNMPEATSQFVSFTFDVSFLSIHSL